MITQELRMESKTFKELLEASTNAFNPNERAYIDRRMSEWTSVTMTFQKSLRVEQFNIPDYQGVQQEPIRAG